MKKDNENFIKIDFFKKEKNVLKSSLRIWN